MKQAHTILNRKSCQCGFFINQLHKNIKIIIDESEWMMYSYVLFFICLKGKTMFGVLKKKTQEELDNELYTATENSDIKKVKHALEKGANVNARNVRFGYTAFIEAAQNRNIEISKELLKYGADVNAKSNAGETALMCASYWGHIEYVEFLLENGAEVDTKNENGETAFFKAGSRREIEVAKILFSHGADIDVKTNGGKTPLMDASYWGHAGWIGFLLANGADADVSDRNGTTALINATWAEKTDVIKVLLAYGADARVCDNKDRTARDYAKRQQHTEIIELFDTHEKKTMVPLYNQQLQEMQPNDILAPEIAPMLKEIKDAGLLTDVFEGLDCVRQNALLVACWDEISADEKLNQKIQQTMQESLNKEQSGKIDVPQLGIFNTINQLVKG